MAFRVTTRQQATSSGQNGTVHLMENGQGDRAEVWPALGFNCFSWKTIKGGQELDLLYADSQLFGSGRPTRSGIPILFPFPNRIRQGRFTWSEKRFQLPQNDSTRKNAIHGFVCRKAWRLSEQGADATSAWLTGEFQLSREDPDSQSLWPADFVLRVTYRLSVNKLRVEAEVYNPDRLALPFGLGYHPYFRVPLLSEPTTEECMIQVPARAYWQLEETLPTGKVLPVDAARDFRKPRAFRCLEVDEVLTDIAPEGPPAPAGMRWNGSMSQAGRTLHFFSATAFREIVVFVPPHREAFCLEPYTCPTDAINMPNQGKDVGWMVLQPEQRWKADFEMAVE